MSDDNTDLTGDLEPQASSAEDVVGGAGMDPFRNRDAGHIPKPKSPKAPKVSVGEILSRDAPSVPRKPPPPPR